MYNLRVQALILSLTMLKTRGVMDPWILKHDLYDNHDLDEDQKAEEAGTREGHKRVESRV